MNKKLLLYSMIIGMENMGAKYVKLDDTHIYFDIPKDSELNDEQLKRSKDAFTQMFNLGLKVRKL